MSHKKKGKSCQNKFMKIIKMPIKALGKARDCYVRTMNNYADTGTYEGLGWGGPVYNDPIPRSLSTTRTRSGEMDHDLRELVRTASTGALENRVNMTSIVISSSNEKCNRPMQNKKGTLCSKGTPRSANVVMAKIEENEAN
ncbi:hypothetical protein RND81_10G085100 [Saponaria officinalis]|uniref:Uncharacterized protein n=1 Tax=Saponaria officinalis TaxID=3572 RepID=A0AAW1HZI0_SAPOF